MELKFTSAHSYKATDLDCVMSRYLRHGSPVECRYCCKVFQDRAIRDTETNHYYCTHYCLERDRLEAFRIFDLVYRKSPLVVSEAHQCIASIPQL
jgi:hypothetical protein